MAIQGTLPRYVLPFMVLQSISLKMTAYVTAYNVTVQLTAYVICM